MIDNAKSAIEQMVALAEEMSINVFNVSSFNAPVYEDTNEQNTNNVSEEQEKVEEVQQQQDDGIIRVDLGNGKYGKINVDNLNNAGAPK